MDKKELSKLLADNLNYFVGADKRCKRPDTVGYNGGVIQGSCTYSGKTLGKDTNGCFIGNLLPEDVRVKLDNAGFGGVSELICDVQCDDDGLLDFTLPDYMLENVDLMNDLQSLHDMDIYWNGFVLSDNGKGFLKCVIKENELVLEDFEKFL